VIRNGEETQKIREEVSHQDSRPLEKDCKRLTHQLFEHPLGPATPSECQSPGSLNKIGKHGLDDQKNTPPRAMMETMKENWSESSRRPPIQLKR